jgi:hypothetical protein
MALLLVQPVAEVDLRDVAVVVVALEEDLLPPLAKRLLDRLHPHQQHPLPIRLPESEHCSP